MIKKTSKTIPRYFRFSYCLKVKKNSIGNRKIHLEIKFKVEVVEVTTSSILNTSQCDSKRLGWWCQNFKAHPIDRKATF